MKKTVFILRRNSGNLESTSAYEIPDVGFNTPYHFVVHKTPSGTGWMVSNVETGLLVGGCGAETRKAAVASAIKYFERLGSAQINDVIKRTIKKHKGEDKK